MNVVLTNVMKDDYNAGSKARNDVRDILSQDGFVTHVLFNKNHNNVSKMFELITSMRRLESVVSADDMVVLQYPLSFHITKWLTKNLVKMRKRTKIKIVYLIHDVYYIRGDQRIDANKLQKEEIGIFNQVDALIVHNEKMKERLELDGVTVKMTTLGLFDYLTKSETPEVNDHEGVAIDFAGNLSSEKSGFLYHLNRINEVHFNIYGNGYDGNQSNVKYLGSFPPDQLAGALIGDYGLVWDGHSIDGCEGSYGSYLKYNNPHKISLYLAAHKPVVVWNQSALAEYVEKNKIGICVSNLEELNGLPMNKTAEYSEMVKNVKSISEKLREGGFLLSAIFNTSTMMYKPPIGE